MGGGEVARGDDHAEAVGEPHRERVGARVPGGVGAGEIVREDGGGRAVGGDGGVNGAGGGEGADPVLGAGAGVARLYGRPGVGLELLEGEGGVGRGEGAPQDACPLGGRAAVLGEEQIPVVGHRGGRASQIERAGGDGEEVDPVDLFGVVGPPRGVAGAVGPDDAGERPREARGEDRLVGVEPVLLDGDRLGGVEVDAEVADVVAAHDRAPEDESGREVHGLRRALLVVASVEGGVARGPAVGGVGVEVSQEGVAGVGAVPVGDVADEQFDDFGVVVGPGGVVHGDHGGGEDVVAVVEVVVVHLLGEVEAAGGAEECAPVGVVGEVTRAGVGVEPVFELGFGVAEEGVPGGGVAGLLGDGGENGGLLHGLAGPVGVGAEVEVDGLGLVDE